MSGQEFVNHFFLKLCINRLEDLICSVCVFKKLVSAANNFYSMLCRSSHRRGKGETCKNQKENEEKGMKAKHLIY